MSLVVRILLLADSHLGFDLPTQTRVTRRRRGHDFVANYHTALAPALDGEVDLVVHAGDVFDRPSVLPSIAYQAYEPLRRVADRGVPVFVVPGNHERSRLPHARLASHRHIHVFDRARTFVTATTGGSIALSGFPYERRDVRTNFAARLEETRWRDDAASIRLLCLHHCFEGATVGPANFVFTTASDVIRTRDIPRDFAVVFSGHIHRHQTLTHDLARRPLDTPVFYPGSIERTAFAEMDEPKGFMVVHISESEGDVDVRWEFRRLPARPMVLETLNADAMDGRTLQAAIHAIISVAPADAVLTMRIEGALTEEHWKALSAARVREFAPETMNVELRPVAEFVRRRARSATVAEPSAQLSFC
jgi:DNA repair exonuclease SbcCD nuclease subunit